MKLYECHLNQIVKSKYGEIGIVKNETEYCCQCEREYETSRYYKFLGYEKEMNVKFPDIDISEDFAEHSKIW